MAPTGAGNRIKSFLGELTFQRALTVKEPNVDFRLSSVLGRRRCRGAAGTLTRQFLLRGQVEWSQELRCCEGVRRGSIGQKEQGEIVGSVSGGGNLRAGAHSHVGLEWTQPPEGPEELLLTIGCCVPEGQMATSHAYTQGPVLSLQLRI